ncbi:molybdenum cofactor synthesis protein [Sulfolobus acidocaldarius SUSAZ]|nr:molybdenum cofactor synthesis protein [Sulfolobus acidocaldarius SUSAZ]
MLISLEEARKIIDNANIRNANIRSESIYNAVGKVAGRDIVAKIDIPEFNISAMDGFAFNISDYKKYGKLKIAGKIFPSSLAIPQLKEGEAYYVATGSPIPKGANAVARIEATKISGDNQIVFSEDVFEGKDIKFAGEDVKKGDIIVRKGEVINHYHLGVLTMQKIREVNIVDINSCVLASGDELCPYDSPEDNKIPDSISPILISILRKFGVTNYFGIVSDQKESLKTKLESMIENCDYIVLIGGSSVGEKDYSKRVIAELGELLFEGVSVNIIKRGGVGVVNGKPIINLPGQVVSALTVFHEHGLHMISRMIGQEVRKYEKYILSEDMQVEHKMDSIYLFNTIGVLAKPLRWGTGLYSELIKAKGFGVLKRGRIYHKGDEIELQHLIL